jgi:nitrate reductase NapE component
MSIAAFISIADLYILFFEVAAIAAYGRLEVAPFGAYGRVWMVRLVFMFCCGL